MTTALTAQTPVHGRRRAAASPFDEIARVGSDGQPYWSARDLANALGYVQWRNFVEAIRKAREQVASHGSAGQDHFADASKMVGVGSGASRTIPDVHLTRFAAYFVALNADQSKPEVKAAVNYYFVGRTIQAETMITAGAADPELTAQTAERLAAMEATLAGLPEVVEDAVRKALAGGRFEEGVEAGGHFWPKAMFQAESLGSLGSSQEPRPLPPFAQKEKAKAEKARAKEPEFTGTFVGEVIPDSYPSISAAMKEIRGSYSIAGAVSPSDFVTAQGLVRRRLIAKRPGGRSVYGYTVTAKGRDLLVAGSQRGGGRGRSSSPARLRKQGGQLYLTPKGQEWAKKAFAREG